MTGIVLDIGWKVREAKLFLRRENSEFKFANYKKMQTTNNTETENKCNRNNLGRLAFKLSRNRIIQVESLAGTNALRHWKTGIFKKQNPHRSLDF